MSSKLDYSYTFSKQYRPEQVLPKGHQKGPLLESILHIGGAPTGSRKGPPKGTPKQKKMMTFFDSKMKVLWGSFQDCPGTALDVWGSPPAAWPCPPGRKT